MRRVGDVPAPDEGILPVSEPEAATVPKLAPEGDVPAGAPEPVREGPARRRRLGWLFQRSH
jgi:hypothetical protein